MTSFAHARQPLVALLGMQCRVPAMIQEVAGFAAGEQHDREIEFDAAAIGMHLPGGYRQGVQRGARGAQSRRLDCSSRRYLATVAAVVLGGVEAGVGPLKGVHGRFLGREFGDTAGDSDRHRLILELEATGFDVAPQAVRQFERAGAVGVAG